jgi:hypothetical protein
VTDGQLTIVISAAITSVGTFVAAMKWAVNRVTKSNDDGTTALIANTASNAVLTTKMDALMNSNQRLADRLDMIGDFVEEHTPVGVSIPRRATPAGGIRSPRPGTHHDKDH